MHVARLALLLPLLVAACGEVPPEADPLLYFTDTAIVSFEVSASSASCRGITMTPANVPSEEAMRCRWSCAFYRGDLADWTVWIPQEAGEFLPAEVIVERAECTPLP
jgi:hypothetical protein